MHRTIMIMVRITMFASGLPMIFWGDAAKYAAHILNRNPSAANPGRQSPLQMLTNKVPTLSDIVIFGSPCTVHQDAKNKSLGARGKRGLIVGKSDEIKGYRVYIPGNKMVVVTQRGKLLRRSIRTRMNNCVEHICKKMSKVFAKDQRKS